MSYQNPSRKHASRFSTPVRLGVAAVAACFISAPVLSLPVNPTVVNGAASFDQAGKILTVTNTPGAIINWQKFSIGAGETTHFAQTSASSTVLNRVLADPTAIYGTLSSNGRVWLVNPAGIMVGPGGRVDVAGFVASTLNIRNEDFLAGRNVFINDTSAKDVINQGEIRTPAGGSVYLIGSNVTNEGIITTPKGETILAAGATVSLIDSATPGVKVDITGSEGNATNLGTITAEAGRIGIAGVIVRNSGQINASSVVSEGGRVFLKASQDAYVDGNGRIVTTGTKGGSVEVLGNRVAVKGNAEIDASGTNGGGKILVGGDYQGKNPDVQNANVSYFGPDATLKADAKEVGDGGTVIVWADDTTRAYGNISARGGALGGNGGFVETSGKRYLSVDGIHVDTRAPQGKTGTWLLDPSDITIFSGSYGAGTNVYGSTVVSGVTTSEFTTAPGNSSSTISDGTITTMLVNTDVVIHTAGGTGGNGNITVTPGVNIYGGDPGMALTLAAAGTGSADSGNITITDSTIVVRDGVTLLAGWNGVMPPYGLDGNTLSSADVMGGTGSITIAGSTIQSSEWAVNLWAGKDITLTNSGTKGTLIQAANIDVQAGNNLSLIGGDTASGPQGPGVMLHMLYDVLHTTGPQTIKAGNQILLQAGSANNTYGGSPFYGGSVGIVSDASQIISANAIKVYGGASGHDNSAEIQAYGSQSISVYGGGLEVKGGGSVDSYNNQARIQHGQSFYGDNVYTGVGDQTITIYGGGTVNVQAGSGTGVLGYYGSDCASLLGEAACRGSGNGAEIDNGIGLQTLAFIAGGTLTVTGGNAGTDNWAGIESNGPNAGTQAIYGSPNITLTGGSAGGSAVSYGDEIFENSNDAGIYSDGAGSQYITAGTLTIYGGNATYGGAGISNDGSTPQALQIVTTGNMSMYGGTSNAAHLHGAAVYIHSEAGGPITLDVGGNLYVKSGSGTSTPAIIGSVDASGDVKIMTGGNVTIIADGSGVGIGALSPGYGATVSISSYGGITTSSTGSKGVLIGSAGTGMYGFSGPTNVTLNAGSDLALGSNTLVGVANLGAYSYVAPGSVRLVAGWDGVAANPSAGYGSIIAGGAAFSTYGGSFTALASDNIALGSVNTDAPADYYGNSGGSVYAMANNGTLSVASVSAKGGDAFGSYFSGYSGGSGGNVSLQSYGGLTLGTGGIAATGGNGGDGGEGGWSGGQGGQGGWVTLTSLAGNVAVNGNITANGGAGGKGASGYSNTSYGGALGGSGGGGGSGGWGGHINLNATAGSVVLAGSVSLNATGGMGGQGGAGGNGTGLGGIGITGYSGCCGYGYYIYGPVAGSGQGGNGGWGGQGGGGGDIMLQGGTIVVNSGASLTANGGIGGQGDIGGNGVGTSYGGYTGSAWGGSGGSGGRGGSGGVVSLASGNGGISVVSGALAARGGQGGYGSVGGTATVDGVSQSGYGGYAGHGGDGGNYYYSGGGFISLTSYGDIALSGTLDTRGGAGGSGAAGAAYGGDSGTGGRVLMIAGSVGGYGYTTNGTTGSITGSSASITTGGGNFTAIAGNSITLGSVNTDQVASYYGYSGGNVSMRADYGSLAITTISAKGGDTFGSWYSGYSGGSGGNVSLQSYGGLTIGTGGIVTTGGTGADGDQGGSGGSGGSGGWVTLTSLTGNVAVNGNITANGGVGGNGGKGYSNTGYGGFTSGGSGYQGGAGGMGGYVSLNATAGSVVLAGGVSLSANGGLGGNGGAGGNGSGFGGQAYQVIGYAGYTPIYGWVDVAGSGQGGSGGWGGQGGRGGSIMLQGGTIVVNSGAGLAANGGIGGQGGIGGNGVGTSYGGYTGYAWGGSGGNGGSGGIGGELSLASGNGGISIVSGTLAARGGQGGSGNAGGTATVDGVTPGYPGYAGRGGDGGNYYYDAGSISLTSYGDIALSGTLDTRGGVGGSGGTGAYGGDSGAGGSVLMIAGSVGGYGYTTNGTTGSITGSSASITTGGGNVSAIAGNSITLGSVNTDGTMGYSAGNVYMRADYGSLAITTISAKGGSGFWGGDGGEGGNVMLQSYGGLTIGTGGINTTGGTGGDGGEGGPGPVTFAFSGAAGSGGSGGQVNLTTLTGNVAINGNITSNGGNGGNTSGYGPGYFGPSNNGGSAGSINVSAPIGSIVLTNASLSANGGDGGNSDSGYAGYGIAGGYIGLTGYGGISMTSSSLSANGGKGGNAGYGYGGNGGRGGYIALANSYGGISMTGSSISANGGNGGTAGEGYAGYAGNGAISIVLNSSFGGISMTGSSISANGGNGGSAGYGSPAYGAYSGDAGIGGVVSLSAGSSIVLTGNSSINAYGGTGGFSFGYGYGSVGGQGGEIWINSNTAGSITLSGSTLNVSGGTGGNSVYGGYWGGDGGKAGDVNLQTAYGSIALSGGSFIFANGGAGGKGSNDDPYNGNAAYPGGNGGGGGNVMLSANGTAAGISMGSSAITAAGGAGGAGGTGGSVSGYGGDGGFGGSGGVVSLFANGAIESATVHVNGGLGGSGGAGATGYGAGIVGDPGGGGSVDMTSSTGGSATTNAISAAVVGADSLVATASGVYGGINVGHTGLQPATLVISDAATSYGSINFSNSGDLNLDGSQTFATTTFGSTQIGSGGALSVTGSLSGYDISLGGATIDVNGGAVFANNNVVLGAGAINVSYGGEVIAGNNAALITPLVGGAINLVYGGGVYAGANGAASSINGIPYQGIAFLAQNLNGDYGGFLDAGGFYGGISGLLSGNLTGQNGAYFAAGDDITVAFAGSESTISLSSGAHFLADYATSVPATIYLDFLTRSGGGVMIDGSATTTSSPGGSGFFVVDHSTPAVLNSTLVITYANTVTVDPCVSSPDICKPPLPVDIPIVDPCATAPDSAQCKAYQAEQEKEKTERDEFGEADDGKKDEQSSHKKVAQCGV